MPTTQRARRLLDRVFEVQLWIACLALVVMMLVIVLDVAMRYFLNNPLRGSYDVVQTTLVIMVLFGLPRIFADGAHIAIDLIDNALPKAGRRLLIRSAAVLSVLTLAFVFYAMTGPLMSAWRYGEHSLELNLPQWIVWLIALVGVAGSILAALVSLLGGPRDSDSATEAFE